MIEHGGNLAKLAELAGCEPGEILDFSVNLNPLGPPPGVFEPCFRSFDRLGEYPEPYAESLVAMLAERWRLPAARIVAGNGSNLLLNLLPPLTGAKRALIVTPGYLGYAEACRNGGLPVVEFRLREEEDFILDPARLGDAVEPGDLVILGNPDNPTGYALPRAELEPFVAAHPGALFLIDEAFIEFYGEAESLAGVMLPNLVVSRSFTKIYAVPGLRMGAMSGPEELMARLRARQGEWVLSAPAVETAKFLLALPGGFPEETRRETERLRGELAAGLDGLPGFKTYPSCANYLLFRAPCADLPERLLAEHRIALRSCAAYPGLGPEFCRVAVRPAEERERLLAALRGKGPYLPKKRKTPALMLQGTCSNAGKSVLAAAFCRILLEDGFSVAPFKAQNMALNSYVTPDGGEIGRAQAVQAEACRLDPDVRMNPILLKPDSDLGSQVVLNGRAIGNFKVREYFQRKPELWGEVAKAYDSLASEHDVIVLEGAGSPGEINLKSGDLVNMRMARHAGARVLLVGDIDRGGVYASFVGTYATLEPWERALLSGFLVNKFRGDPTLLADAHAYVERMTGRPVRGVIDYQRDLGLPEEDSVSFSFVRPAEKEAKTLDIVLIRLGYIANFTDFTPFEIEPDVTLRKVSSPADFGAPDAVILPGSKSVAADLARLRESGLAAKVAEAAESGVAVAGICGGLQLLGERLLDPDGIESAEREVRCLGLLPLETVMRRRKTLRRTRGFRPDGTEISGYEIHHGETVPTGPGLGIMRDTEGRMIGFERGGLFASYLHGIFDDDRFRRLWLDGLRRKKGWAPKGGVTASYGVEEALNRLAAHVRSRVDIDGLYRELGVR